MGILDQILLIIKGKELRPRIRSSRYSEDMTRIILLGSFIVTALLITLLLISFIFLGHHYVIDRITIGVLVLMYLSIIALFNYKNHVKIGAWMLLGLYASLGILIIHTWGINAPVGILVLAFVIVLGSIVLGAKYIIAITSGIIVALILLQYFSITGLSKPDRSMLDNSSTYGDVASYAIIFGILALITWLAGRKMEKALERAAKAETALERERDSLAIRVQEQTKSLRDAQHKELRQLYKFAELGQLTTIILHELANYLSILTLDIDDLEERHQSSVAIEHAKESIFYIDTIIDQVRNQIKDSNDTKKFDSLVTVKESLNQLRKKLISSNIKLSIEDDGPKVYLIFGDPLRLSQALTILVTNAAQANTNKQSEISIHISSTNSKILISVKDFGAGINLEARRNLFQPQKSTKGAGMGIGLYITKQIIDTHFKGKIWLNPVTEYTQFNIELPRIKR